MVSKEIELEKLKHKHKLEEIEAWKGLERLKHELEKERMRIKSAEIRRSLLLKMPIYKKK